MDSKAFGQHIRKLRMEKGVSLRKMAQRMEISVAYLSYIERGVQGTPSAEVIKRLARELEVNPDALLAMTGRIDTSRVDMIREELDRIATSEKQFSTPKEAGEAVAELLNFLVLQSSFNEMLNLKGSPEFNAEKTYGDLREMLQIDGGLPRHNEQALLEHFESVVKLWRKDFEK